MAEVRLDAVRKVYDHDVVAVHDATFSVADGEFMVLVGPSGCGKSTLLRLIAGLESVSAGSIFIGERRVNEVPPKDRNVAMVFQSYALYPHMTAFENMAFGLTLRKHEKADIRRRVHEAADILGIGSILGRRPGQLSGGQRQRVAVGRAIVRKPEVFLFDEPLSNLDARLRVHTRAEIAKLHGQLGATMIYVTHDQIEAMTMGDRIIVVNEGRIQQVDVPLALYDRPANRFVAAFIGSPGMNFVEGRIVGRDGMVFRALDGVLELPLDASAYPALARYVGKPVVLGIRPESLFVADSPFVPAQCSETELTVEVVEPMGHEIFLYATAGGTEFVARIAPQALPAPGDPIRLALDLRSLHFFDVESGRAVGSADPHAAAA